MENVKKRYKELLDAESSFRNSFIELVNKNYEIGGELEELSIGSLLNIDAKILDVHVSIYPWE